MPRYFAGYAARLGNTAVPAALLVPGPPPPHSGGSMEHQYTVPRGGVKDGLRPHPLAGRGSSQAHASRLVSILQIEIYREITLGSNLVFQYPYGLILSAHSLITQLRD